MLAHAHTLKDLCAQFKNTNDQTKKQTDIDRWDVNERFDLNVTKQNHVYLNEWKLHAIQAVLQPWTSMHETKQYSFASHQLIFDYIVASEDYTKQGIN